MRRGRVDPFDQFTVANASGPADFSDAGGFDETFVLYGGENPLGAMQRLMAADPWMPIAPDSG